MLSAEVVICNVAVILFPRGNLRFINKIIWFPNDFHSSILRLADAWMQNAFDHGFHNIDGFPVTVSELEFHAKKFP